MDGSSGVVSVSMRPERRPEGPIAELLASFHRKGISYCYWRSSRRISAALAGHSDLDLLVAKRDQYRAHEILLQCGFKGFPAVAHRDHPAISSFLGYDDISGGIVHVHLHVRLVVGGALLKTHRLAWEETVLARAVYHPVLPIRVLDPIDEALLTIVRACLELRPTDLVALRRWVTLKRRFAADVALLAAQLDRAAVLTRASDMVSADLATLLTEAVFVPPAYAKWRRLRRGIRSELGAWRGSNAVEQHLRSGLRTALWAAGYLNARYFHLARPSRRRAPGGGAVVAIIGVDGSGKSTVTAAIKAWLDPEIDVMPIYFGTGGGRPSLVLLPLKLMVPPIMYFLRTKPKGSSHGRISDRPPGPLYSALMMAWAGVLSIEKRIKLLAARRGAERGIVVIGDRYPQDQEAGYNDGPLLPRLNRAPRWLRTFEARAYALARRLPPDLIIRLDVSPETAAKREPSMNPELIRERIATLRRLVFPGAKVVCVDAEQPLATVLDTVKREVWNVL